MKTINRLFAVLATIVVCAAGLLGTASSASATAATCQPTNYEKTQSQCLNIYGNGLHIDTVQEDYRHTGYISKCNYGAKWYGNFQASGPTTYYSAVKAACTVYTAYSGRYTVGNGWMANNSYFYGYWKSNLSAGAWTSAARLTITT